MDYQSHIIQSKIITSKVKNEHLSAKYTAGNGWRIYDSLEEKFVSPFMSYNSIDMLLNPDNEKEDKKPDKPKNKTLLDFGYKKG